MEVCDWWDGRELWREVEVDEKRRVLVWCVWRADDEASQEIETRLVGTNVDLVGGE